MNDDMRERLSAYLDGVLPPDERAAVDMAKAMGRAKGGRNTQSRGFATRARRA
jgi:hypothetical protein